MLTITPRVAPEKKSNQACLPSDLGSPKVRFEAAPYATGVSFSAMANRNVTARANVSAKAMTELRAQFVLIALARAWG